MRGGSAMIVLSTCLQSLASSRAKLMSHVYCLYLWEPFNFLKYILIFITITSFKDDEGKIIK